MKRKAVMLVLLTVSTLSMTLSAPLTQRVPLNNTVMASTSLPPSLVLLGGGAKWAARNGSSVLFINWKDNWLAHHLTDGTSWGPWPSESQMDSWRSSILYTLGQSGFNVQLTGDIPENLSGYDLVVIHAYWAVEPRHETLIRNYIFNGGGVVILRGVPSYIVVYCKDMWPGLGGEDLTTVEEWFGAAAYGNTGGNAIVTVENPFGTGLQTGDPLVERSGYSCASVRSLSNNDALVLAEWETGPTFAFAHKYGQGRVYYQAAFDGLRAPKPSLWVDDYEFYDDNLTRTSFNVTDVWGIGIKLGYNNTLLEAVRVYPGDVCVTQGTEKWLPNNATGQFNFDRHPVINNTRTYAPNYAYVWVSVLLQKPNYFSGSGEVFKIEFHIIKAPPMNKAVSCILDLGAEGYTEVLDSNADPIDHYVDDGSYTYIGRRSVVGDINGDGYVTLEDVGKLDLIYSGWITGQILVARADINGDGDVTLVDVGKLNLIYSGHLP